jgi:uracil DNA glycosylase
MVLRRMANWCTTTKSHNQEGKRLFDKAIITEESELNFHRRLVAVLWGNRCKYNFA